MEKLSPVKVKMPEELIKSLDILVDVGIYPSRDEAIRDAIRLYIEESKGDEKCLRS